jgi:hypothetical protein
MTKHIELYRTHSRWSDPGHLRQAVVEVAAVPEIVARVVSGLILHAWLVPMHNVAVPATAVHDYWKGRHVREILECLWRRDGREFTVARPPQHRFFGCCRHYALLAAAIFRTHAVPARVRVGFATYFAPGFLEDHWVCEYWDGVQWRLLDAELDETAVQHFGITFSPWDVPRGQFLDASSTWCALRQGKLDPGQIGLSTLGLPGVWFAAHSVLRDIAALNKEELFPWDTWSVGRTCGPGREPPHRTAAHLSVDCLCLGG